MTPDPAPGLPASTIAAALAHIAAESSGAPVTPDPAKTTFRQWLARHDRDDTPIGDIARDLRDDSCMRARTEPGQREHLEREHGASDAALEAHAEAWRQYRLAARRDPAPDPTAELRAAAARLRDLATAATSGPWRAGDTHLGQYGYTATVLSGKDWTATDLRAWLPSMSQQPWDETRNVWADAAYIAAMDPAVGLALADWLEQTASHLTATARPEWQELVAGPALAVARAVLTETTQEQS